MWTVQFRLVYLIPNGHVSVSKTQMTTFCAFPHWEEIILTKKYSFWEMFPWFFPVHLYILLLIYLFVFILLIKILAMIYVQLMSVCENINQQTYLHIFTLQLTLIETHFFHFFTPSHCYILNFTFFVHRHQHSPKPGFHINSCTKFIQSSNQKDFTIKLHYFVHCSYTDKNRERVMRGIQRVFPNFLKMRI